MRSSKMQVNNDPAIMRSMIEKQCLLRTYSQADIDVRYNKQNKSKYLIFLLGAVSILAIFQLLKKPSVEVRLVEVPVSFDTFVPPFVNYTGNYHISHAHKIAGCSIGKSMSQLMTNVMCYLYNETLFEENNQTMWDTWHDEQPCRSQIDFYSGGMIDWNTYKMISFIRDPIDRFASFYVDKCINEKHCFGCGQYDFHCTVKRLYDYLMNISKKPVDQSALDYTGIHASPLSWYCQFGTHYPKYTAIKIGTSLSDRGRALLEFVEAISDKNVTVDTVKEIFTGSMMGDTVHETYTSADRRTVNEVIKNDPYVREYLQKIYFFDYLVFNFTRDALDPQYQSTFWDMPETMKELSKYKNNVSQI